MQCIYRYGYLNYALKIVQTVNVTKWILSEFWYGVPK